MLRALPPLPGTCAVEASSGQSLMVNGMLDTYKAAQPLLKALHGDTRAWTLSALPLAPLLCASLGWDVAHVMPQDEEAVGEVFGMFSPSRVSSLPAPQHASTAEALHPVALPQRVKACLGQISRSHWDSGGPRDEGLEPGILAAHVGGHGVGGLINHLSCS